MSTREEVTAPCGSAAGGKPAHDFPGCWSGRDLRKPRPAPAALLLLAALCSAPGNGLAAGDEPVDVADLLDLSLEELANIEITSVSRRPERLADAPGAIFLITREDIRRSGATSIPEILRLAPNLQVARVRSNSWAITARGFNATSANKLLVLIDGRTVYTPLFSGVFWDVQDTFIEDIERIEVISGPGATLWGSNAVNGVINITTRHSSETTGGLVSLGGGTEEAGLGARYGGRLGEDASYRVYAKGFDRDHTETAAGVAVQDGWRKGQAGFRLDWGGARDTLTLQGDAYDGFIDQTSLADDSISGANVLGRWTRALGEDSSVRVQGYFDRTRRSITTTFGEVLDTWDIEAQHRFPLGERHDVIWGGGFRHSRDEVENRAPLAFLPPERSLHIANVFAQDTISLTGALDLTLGLKLEDNNYTGLELQPSARLGWKLHDDTLLWGAVSRAVRTPSRLDRDLFIPGTAPFSIAGGRGFESETLIAYELGYRATPSPSTSFSVSAFYHDYDELRSIEAAAGGAILDNEMEGEAWGLEAWGEHRPSGWWTLKAGFSWLEQDLRFDAGSRDIAGLAAAGNDPTFQLQMRSLMDLPHDLELDLWLRAVDELPDPRVPGYVTLDARLGWRPWERFELSLLGTNLLDGSHAEFGAEPARSEIDRAVLLQMRWGFR